MTHRWRLYAIATIVCAAIIIPFLAVGDHLEVWSGDALRASAERPRLVAIVIVLLLVVDVVLPIPSSIVSATAGLLLGFGGGVAASATGMTLGAVLAYGLGRSGAGVAQRFVGVTDAGRLERAFERHGDWLIALSRPVPVLAEAATAFAGMARMPMGRFIAMAGLASVGVSAVYAFVGAYAAEAESFVLAFAGAVLVPLGPMLWLRRQDRARPRVNSSADACAP